MIREQGPTLEQSARWIAEFRGDIIVVKLGGELLINPSTIQRVAKQIAVLSQCGMNPIVVHGAGKQLDEASHAAGLKTTKINGRRVTDEPTRDLLVQVLKDLNQKLCDHLQEQGIVVSGMKDFENWPIECTKRKPVQQTDGSIVDFGFVGDVSLVNLNGINSVPVLPSLGYDKELGFLNINADTLAASIGASQNARKLVFLTSVSGVMRNLDDAGPISTISLQDTKRLLEQPAITGGMKAKLEECIRALESGVDRVHIIGGKTPHNLLREVFTDEGCGTLIYRDSYSH